MARGAVPRARTSSVAATMARIAAFDFGQVARYVAACASASRPSGRPTKWTASFAATAIASACGSALPTSSAAKITMRRATNSGSSPASSMRMSQ